jgi:hypothetical protein
MDREMEKVVASIAVNREIVEKLDEVLSGPGDRAYIVCSVEECRNNLLGHCTIHTVKGPREMLANGRCKDYDV